MAKPNSTTLTAERARELLRYDPETGRLSWRGNAGRSGRIPAGTEAGCVFDSGGRRYRQVQIDGRGYYAHRLAWLIVTGAWPAAETDHISGDTLDNSWRNLREVSHTGNSRNQKRRSDNTSGLTGVVWNKPVNKWQAQITVNGTNIYLGLFDNLPAAIAARKAAERRYGFHANHGRAA